MKVLTKINRCKMCAMAVLVGSGLTSLFYLLRETQNVEINKNNRDGYLAQVEAEDKLQMTNVACDNNSAKNTQSQMINRNLFDYISYYLRETPYPGVLNYTNYMITFMNMTPLESVEPVLPGFTPVVNDVRSFEYDVELKHCAPADATTLLVVINSAAGNLNRRNAIRQTWLKTLKSEVLNTIRGPNGRRVALAGLVFMIGRKPDGSRYENLKAEREEFGDILEINVVDTYYSLSAKVAALLNWIDSRCSGVDFVLKTDDDIYVNVRNLVSFIHQLDPEQPFLYGKLTHGTVQRGSKWKMTYEEYPWQQYPNYYAGASFLMAGKAVRPLLAAAQTIPYHPFDDLYITGFCSERADVTLFNCDRFYIGGIEGSAPEACFVRNTVSWLLDNVDKILSSHSVTEQYYNNAKQCTPLDSSQPSDPKEHLTFSYKQLAHLRT